MSTVMNQNKIINKTPICRHEGCKKQPSFNYQSYKLKKYCAKHKLPNMVNLNYENKLRPTNIHGKCDYEGCNEISTYRSANSIYFTHCELHRSLRMTNKLNRKLKDICHTKSCNNFGTYNYPYETNGMHCFSHKLEGMVFINSLNCIDCKEIPLYGYAGCKAYWCELHYDRNNPLLIKINEQDEFTCKGCYQTSLMSKGVIKLCYRHT